MPTRTQEDAVAKALYATLFSPNETDSNFEPANVVDQLGKIARGLFAVAKAIDGLTAAVSGDARQAASDD